jgi:hypothetical protein
VGAGTRAPRKPALLAILRDLQAHGMSAEAAQPFAMELKVRRLPQPAKITASVTVQILYCWLRYLEEMARATDPDNTPPGDERAQLALIEPYVATRDEALGVLDRRLRREHHGDDRKYRELYAESWNPGYRARARQLRAELGERFLQNASHAETMVRDWRRNYRRQGRL